MVAPLGGMYQAGTLSGNPIAMAAGISTLKELQKQDPYQKFNELGSILEVILLESAKKYGVDLIVNKFGSMLNPFFSHKSISNFDDAQQCDTKQFATFFWELIKEGVFIPPSQFEAWFLSSALSENDIEKTSKAIDKAMEAVSKM